MYAHVDMGGKKYKATIVETSERDLTLVLPEEFENLEFIKKYTQALDSFQTPKRVSI
ncbi:MAG: hypothetical protein N2Z80_06910 [Hydrogenothermaceae bacterium]|nr:hypothetical protein [Hydrogenothermaceae bacterium]